MTEGWELKKKKINEDVTSSCGSRLSPLMGSKVAPPGLADSAGK